MLERQVHKAAQTQYLKSTQSVTTLNQAQPLYLYKSHIQPEAAAALTEAENESWRVSG